MPSLKKTLHFITSALCCAGGVALLAFGMTAKWSSSTVNCKSENSTGKGIVTVGLFKGTVKLISCPYFDSAREIQVIDELENVPLILQYIVIALLVLSLVGSAGSILITLYNSFSNPYVTFMGPVGLYACSGFSVVVSFLALIIYVSYVHLTKFAVDSVKVNAAGATLGDLKVSMELGFFLVLPYIAMNVLAFVLVYLYVHAAYTRQREQQKPTEDAPKEIMMY